MRGATQEWTPCPKIRILRPSHGIDCTVQSIRIFPDTQPLKRHASRSLTLELSNNKKNTHRPQKP
ncbi:hypothetical protein BIFBRE_04655 [Bifidobacterium breve DSM 20213 = JCM 1192]|uniref:Uncharacterized protein n=1 Tax=Bifidobacterium breve DSM 20213 = JCM 1192 TaxID=518634 RepID=D4BRB9_BIFBR|nr:hypothetical protein BIFBRE_04655 [Bifidobacterium breve DSM 20213 = JCM 1192]